MGLFTFVDRISLLCDCRAIMKLMVKLQRCSKQDKARLCHEVETRLQALSSKGAKMPDAAFSIIIPIQDKDNNLFSFMQIVEEDLQQFRNQ
jgi:predicted DNA-binding protein